MLAMLLLWLTWELVVCWQQYYIIQEGLEHIHILLVLLLS